MRYSDIQSLRDGGFISEEQRSRIVDHYQLKEDGSRILTVLTLLGAVLISGGLILLIAANWEEIPKLAKLGAGLVLLAGAHAGGWWLRDGRGDFPRAGEALHVMGSLLFLGNIALVGQIYHLATRLPNAWLLWWIGIAPLPWILRSRALHFLSLTAFGIWFGTEVWATDGGFAFGNGAYPWMLITLMGLVWYGLGLVWRGSRWSLFAPDTERLGLFLYSMGLGPFVYAEFHRGLLTRFDRGTVWPFVIMAGVSIVLLVTGLLRNRGWNSQWRLVWGGVLGAGVGYLALVLATSPGADRGYGDPTATGLAWVAMILLFGLALVQVRMGVELGAEWLINLGVVLIAFDVISIYLTLIESMARTGFIFIVSGIFLIGLGVYLEKSRRRLLRRIRIAAESGDRSDGEGLDHDPEERPPRATEETSTC